MKKQKLTIIGGGVMGLMTALYALEYTDNIAIIDKSTLINKKSSSSGITRSIRQDYLDDFYVKLAVEARLLWEELERKFKSKFIFKSGCFNLIDSKITSKKHSYAKLAYESLKKNNEPAEEHFGEKFDQFKYHYGSLDPNGGVLFLPNIFGKVIEYLKGRGVKILENTNVKKIDLKDSNVKIYSDNENFESKYLSITSGKWTNEVLNLFTDFKLKLPLDVAQPLQCKYFFPTEKDVNKYSWENFPVFAYLDVGIYGHPIVNNSTPGIKIGYFQPTDFDKTSSKIQSINDFVDRIMPELKNMDSENVTDVDQGYYQMTPDDQFILGNLKSVSERVYIGCGWRGTGFKFAPIIGKSISSGIFENKEIYNIFNPNRFEG